jgi:magnesium chelatase subunit I
MDSVLGLVRHSGNDGLFKAIEMSLLATAAGQPLHLHAEGLRGTGKTTIMRAVRRVLPRIRRIRNCLYNCDPAQPHCPHHRSLSVEAVALLGEEWVPTPFLEISHSAKVGTVVGSIDLGRLVNPAKPEAALLPGTLPQAHRGIIFVDEVNRLAETSPELADILLDAMGTKPGRVQIEETGLPAVELPVQVSIWAASNPDEDPGPLEDIRRQLSDRFDFVVYTDRPGDAAVVEQILSSAGGGAWHRPLSALDETEAELFRTRLAGRLPALRSIQLSRPLQQNIAELYSRFNVESLRAVQAIHLGMRLSACMEQREEPSVEDLARITPLALRHRVDQETIKKVTAHLSALQQVPEDPPALPPTPSGRQRFPNISFGGAAVAPAPAAPAAAEPSGQAGESAGRQPAQESAAQPPAAPAPASVQAKEARRDNWLHRTLSGLRRNLSMGGQSTGAAQGGGRQSLSSGRQPQQQGLTAPHRPGRPPAEAGREGMAQRLQPDKPAPQQGKASAAQPPQPMPDPRTMPKVAPPNLARPVIRHEQHELIRTEEELGRR